MYQIGFYIYMSLFRIVALFHRKARKMVVGQREAWHLLRREVDANSPWIWFHASSLGEFEQGRPIMERLRANHPEYKILLTFYSPSGYEVRKDYSGADLICYLPFDSIGHVYDFLNIVQPRMAFFIKYEFWPNYLFVLKKRAIPTYLISGIFRPDQLFFKSYAPFYRKMLDTFTHIFVQNQASIELLRSVGRVSDVSLSGDTRYDRVLAVQASAKSIPVVEAFYTSCQGKSILIAGSSWPKDEAFLIPYFNAHPEWKLIVAPHEIHEEHLSALEAQLQRPFKRYSQTTPEEVVDCDCLIMDCFGLLSSVYRYGDLAYIGGGFGSGIHNTLEAAVYGIPIVFGPKHAKFEEAKALLEVGGAFALDTEADFEPLMQTKLGSDALRKAAGVKAGNLVRNGSGGTDRIVRTLGL
jgi:3-deoxy-D-manno-octulosonic-acid transferase